LIGRWSLSFADIDFVNSKPALTRLGLAAQLKFFASLGFFAIDPGSIPTDGLSYLAEQLGVEAGEIAGYDFPVGQHDGIVRRSGSILSTARSGWIARN
jgi:hypothetical protein